MPGALLTAGCPAYAQLKPGAPTRPLGRSRVFVNPLCYLPDCAGDGESGHPNPYCTNPFVSRINAVSKFTGSS